MHNLKSILKLAIAASFVLGLAACDGLTGQQQRTVTGGAIGAGAGAIVATPVGSIADAVVEGETGMLVEVGDSVSLAIALEKLVLNVGLRQSLGAAARAKYLACFSMANYVDGLEGVYRQAREAFLF